MTRRELLLGLPLAAAALPLGRVELASRRLDWTGAGLPSIDALQAAHVTAITVRAEALATARAIEKLEVAYRYSLGVNAGQAGDHPEWLVDGGSPYLCLNSPYMAEVVKAVGKLTSDGAVFDDLYVPESGCRCRWCVEERERLGLDVLAHNKLVARRVEAVLGKLVKGTVCFNGRPLSTLRGEREAFTHFEIEEGFDHRVRYLRGLGRDCVGIVTNPGDSWNVIANGAKVCVRTDSLQGVAPLFAALRRLEPWTQGCRAVADIGLLTNTEPGLTPAFLDSHQQFDVIDLESDFALYKLILIGEDMKPSERLAAKLDAYGKRGGPVIREGSGNLQEQITALMPRPSVIAPNLPAAARVTMLEQRTQGNLRRIVHIVSTGAVLENIQLSVSLPQHPLGVVLIPSEKPLEFKHNEFYTTFVVPRVDGHQAIAFE